MCVGTYNTPILGRKGDTQNSAASLPSPSNRTQLQDKIKMKNGDAREVTARKLLALPYQKIISEEFNLHVLGTLQTCFLAHLKKAE